MKSTFENFGKGEIITSCNNPNCTECNDCCSMASSITEQELEKIITFIESDKKFLNKIKNKIVDLNNTYKKGTINFKCLFTTEKDKKCLIYDIRPIVCQNFHCDNIVNTPVPENCNYTILHILNYMVNTYMSSKSEYITLARFYQLSYEQYMNNALMDILANGGLNG